MCSEGWISALSCSLQTEKEIFTCFQGSDLLHTPFYLGLGFFLHNSDRAGSQSTGTSGTDGSEGISFPLRQHSQTMSWKWGYFKGPSLKAARSLTPPPPLAHLFWNRTDLQQRRQGCPHFSICSVCPTRVQVFIQAASIAVDTFSLTDKHRTISRTVSSDAATEEENVRVVTTAQLLPWAFLTTFRVDLQTECIYFFF